MLVRLCSYPNERFAARRAEPYQKKKKRILVCSIPCESTSHSRALSSNINIDVGCIILALRARKRVRSRKLSRTIRVREKRSTLFQCGSIVRRQGECIVIVVHLEAVVREDGGFPWVGAGVAGVGVFVVVDYEVCLGEAEGREEGEERGGLHVG